MRGANLPLEGITVVSLEQAVAAPFAPRQLADLGARVVKVERPGVGDFARGYDMYGYSGILSALYRREKTGEGATLEVSMLEALGEWMGFPAYFAGYSGEVPRRSGAARAAIAPYGPFECGDGEVIFLGIQNEREWKRSVRRSWGARGWLKTTASTK